MSSLNPYDVLGLPHNCTWSDVKKAYKTMLVKTHPDKMGNAKYFMMVHEAYQELQIQFKGKAKEQNAPRQKQSYKPIEQDVQPVKMKNFTADKFNRYFDENRINQIDPYSQNGYRD